MVTEYAGLKREVEAVRYKVNELESKFNKNEAESTGTLEDMLVAIKTIAYNQTVIESKFEDILKNQLNTDALVNGMNERLNKVAGIVSGAASIPAAAASVPSGRSSRRSSSANNSSTSLVETNVVVKRRPGRPRKDAGVNKLPLSVNWTLNEQKGSSSSSIADPLRPVKLTLPLNQPLPKNKKYFNDPSDVSNIKSSPAKDQNDETADDSSPEVVPPKKKRGRPPKKKPIQGQEPKQEPKPEPKQAPKEEPRATIPSKKSIFESRLARRSRRHAMLEQEDKAATEDEEEEEESTDDSSSLDKRKYDDDSDDSESESKKPKKEDTEIESNLEELRLATKDSYSVGVKMTNAQRIQYLNQKKDAHQTTGTERAIRMAMELDEKRRDKNKSLRQRMLESLKKSSVEPEPLELTEPSSESASSSAGSAGSEPTPESIPGI